MRDQIKFTKQAEVIIDNLQDFNKNDFIEWLKLQVIQIGSNTILEYLMYKSRKEEDNG